MSTSQAFIEYLSQSDGLFTYSTICSYTTQTASLSSTSATNIIAGNSVNFAIFHVDPCSYYNPFKGNEKKKQSSFKFLSTFNIIQLCQKKTNMKTTQ